MRLVLIAQRSFELIIHRIVNIKIHEIDLSVVLCLEPVHDGRQRLAGRSPVSEELDQLWRPRGEHHRGWIRRL